MKKNKFKFKFLILGLLFYLGATIIHELGHIFILELYGIDWELRIHTSPLLMYEVHYFISSVPYIAVIMGPLFELTYCVILILCKKKIYTIPIFSEMIFYLIYSLITRFGDYYIIFGGI